MTLLARCDCCRPSGQCCLPTDGDVPAQLDASLAGTLGCDILECDSLECGLGCSEVTLTATICGETVDDLCLTWDGTRFTGASLSDPSTTAMMEVEANTTGGCHVYDIMRLTVNTSGGVNVDWVWSEDCEGNAGYAVTVSAATQEEVDDCVGDCPTFGFDAGQGLKFFVSPWTEAELPASLDIEISGATGDCCELVNGEHTLDLHTVWASWTDGNCRDGGNGFVVYQKAFNETIDGCGFVSVLLTLTLDFAAGAGGCYTSVGLAVVVTALAVDPQSCEVGLTMRLCPGCDQTINLAELEQATIDCSWCGLDGISVSGIVYEAG